MMETVELHQAFLWVCEECGTDNFARGVELSPEEVERMGVDPAEDGCYLMAPSEVKCSICEHQYKAVDGK